MNNSMNSRMNKKILAFFLSLSLIFSTIMAKAAPSTEAPASLGGSPQSPLPPSNTIKEELNTIYNAADSVQISPAQGNTPAVNIQPWKDANALLTLVRNATQDIQVKGIIGNLYLQYLNQNGNSVSPYDDLVANYLSISCVGASNEQRFQCQSDSLLQGGAVKVSSVLEGSVYQNQVREILARLFVNSLVNPFPTEALRNADSLSEANLKDPSKRKQIAQALADQAVLSVARESFAEMIAKRKPVPSVGDSSMMQVMEKEAALRFLNAAWQQKMQKNMQDAINKNKPDQAVLYEMAMMDAYQSWMTYEHYRQMERVEALLAALLSVDWQASRAASTLVTNAQAQTTIPTTKLSP
jgi:hypothetical protein